VAAKRDEINLLFYGLIFLLLCPWYLTMKEEKNIRGNFLIQFLQATVKQQKSKKYCNIV
jgi:hypothetical protein